MKDIIEIYLHGAGTVEEKIIAIPETATVHDLIQAAREVGFAHDPNVIIMIEDGEEALEHHTRLCDHGVKHKHHLHYHTCHKIEVTVHFNGVPKKEGFAPSKKVKAVLKWAVKAFELHGVDAENKELRLGSAGGKPLLADHHIGSYTRHHTCHLELYLTAIVEVQG
ncbi:MAG: hypothetical protein WCD79_22430 [Chthoniobacteraceae bacterium]